MALIAAAFLVTSSAATPSSSSDGRETIGVAAPGKFHSVSHRAGPFWKLSHSSSASASVSSSRTSICTWLCDRLAPSSVVMVWPRMILAIAACICRWKVAWSTVPRVASSSSITMVSGMAAAPSIRSRRATARAFSATSGPEPAGYLVTIEGEPNFSRARSQKPRPCFLKNTGQ